MGACEHGITMRAISSCFAVLCAILLAGCLFLELPEKGKQVQSSVSTQSANGMATGAGPEETTTFTVLPSVKVPPFGLWSMIVPAGSGACCSSGR